MITGMPSQITVQQTTARASWPIDIQKRAKPRRKDHQHHIHADMCALERDHWRPEEHAGNHEKLHDLFGPDDRGMKEIAADDIREIDRAGRQQAAGRQKFGGPNNAPTCNQQMVQHECLRHVDCPCAVRSTFTGSLPKRNTRRPVYWVRLAAPSRTPYIAFTSGFAFATRFATATSEANALARSELGIVRTWPPAPVQTFFWAL